ncbi:MAG: carbohydrate transporter permease [Paenibacillaceae bacterium]|jgi:putative aldouronate transport system permease protein|nr:carbohydrate transporter permease [Paenibacillaceae bacterium]
MLPTKQAGAIKRQTMEEDRRGRKTEADGLGSGAAGHGRNEAGLGSGAAGHGRNEAGLGSSAARRRQQLRVVNQSAGSRSFGGLIFDIGNVLFLLLLVSTMIIPLLNTLALSFSTPLDSMEPTIILWPKEISVEGYATVWNKVKLWQPFWNNTIVTVWGTLGHVLLCSLAGYVLIQRNLPGRRLMVTFILLTMMVPFETVMIPVYIVNKELGLLNTLTSLILNGMVSGFSILLMRNYFLAVPWELAESSRLDGASEWRIYARLYLPLAASGLATVTLFEFVGKWNHFTSAVLFLSDTSKYTLQVALKALIIDTTATSSNFIITKNVRMAGIVIALLPLVVIYPFVQRYFVKGVMVGATKE